MTDRSHRYDDIIDLPHHVSEKHPPMPQAQRAAQFAPFAALAGYHESVNESARYTEDHIELDENIRAELDVLIRDALEHGHSVCIEHFVPDAHKDGGEYESAAGQIIKIGEYEKTVILDSGHRIAIANIVDIRPI